MKKNCNLKFNSPRKDRRDLQQTPNRTKESRRRKESGDKASIIDHRADRLVGDIQERHEREVKHGESVSTKGRFSGSIGWDSLGSAIS